MKQFAGWLGTVLGLTLLGGAAQAGGGAPPPRQVAVRCAPDYVRPDFAALERELAAARAQWTAAGVRDYQYEFIQVAAPVLFPAVRVRVRQGTVEEVVLTPGQQGEPGPDARATFEERFAAVARTLVTQRTRPCPVVEVEYAPEEGYLTRLYSGTAELNVADGWTEWRVSRFIRVVQTVPGGS